MARPDDYLTSPDDVVVSPSGWAKVGNFWQTVEPFRDRTTGLYARTSYAGGRQALGRLGLRMPYRSEVIERRAETLRSGGIELPVITQPGDSVMGTLPVAQRFDDLVGLELTRRGWDGHALISNLGKLWIAAGPGDAAIGDHDPATGARGGRARLMGWYQNGKWIQEGYGTSAKLMDILSGGPAVDANHDENHHDYGTLLYGVSETDPSQRPDLAPSPSPAPRSPSGLPSGLPGVGASLAQGAQRISRDTRGIDTRGIDSRGDYLTSPDDVVVSPSGWAKVGNVWQTVEPFRDRTTGLYARTSYAGGRQAIERMGLRMPYRSEVIARRAAALQSGLELPPFNLTFTKTDLDNMSTKPYAQRHDDLVAAELARQGWDGHSILSNVGKMWIAADPNSSDTPVRQGRARLMGWWSPAQRNPYTGAMGYWLQTGEGVLTRPDPSGQTVDTNHDENHHDYGTLLYGVSETDPSQRPDLAPSPSPAPRSPSGLPGVAASLAQGAQRISRDTRGIDTRGPIVEPTVPRLRLVASDLRPKDLRPKDARRRILSSDTGTDRGTDTGTVDEVTPLLLVGDSLAQSLTKPLGAIASAAGVAFKGDGVQSSTIKQWVGPLRSKVLGDLAAIHPKMVLVSLGTNDMRAADPAAAARQAGDLITLIKSASGARVAWIGPPDMPFDSAKTEAFRTALDATCKAAGVQLLDSRMFSIDRAADKIHPNVTGAKLWAQLVADWLTIPFGDAAPAPPTPSSTPSTSSPAPASAYTSAKNITKPMLEWINGILHDPSNFPLGSKADRLFDTRVMQARVSTHPPDAKIPRPHRGVDLWEAPAIYGRRGTCTPAHSAPSAPAPTNPAPPTTPSSDTPRSRSDEAPALVALRSQLNHTFPRRKGAAGQIRASAAHTAKNPNSDHEQGEAIDIFVDKVNGPNLDVLAEALLKDPRTKYVIWRNRIANMLPDPGPNPGWAPGEWRAYPTPWMLANGSKNVDPHTDHLHLSIRQDARGDASRWDLDNVLPSRWDFGEQPPLRERSGEPSPIPPLAGRERIYVAPFQPMKVVGGKRVPDGPSVPIGEMPMALEDYLARVVAAEIPLRPGTEEAAKAQAIAARTFLRYMMQKDPQLGTQAKPIPNSESFQVAAASPSAPALAAAAATRDVLVTAGGRPFLAVYSDGAPWPSGASRAAGADPSITYNAGKTSATVAKAFPKTKSPDDHGRMSQNGALELARQGRDALAILRFFYGNDVSLLGGAGGSTSVDRRTSPSPPSGSSPGYSTSPTATDDSSSSGGAGIAALVIAALVGLAS